MTHFARGSYALVPDYGLILHLPCYQTIMDNKLPYVSILRMFGWRLKMKILKGI